MGPDPFRHCSCPNTHLHCMPQCEVTPAGFANRSTRIFIYYSDRVVRDSGPCTSGHPIYLQRKDFWSLPCSPPSPSTLPGWLFGGRRSVIGHHRQTGRKVGFKFGISVGITRQPKYVDTSIASSIGTLRFNVHLKSSPLLKAFWIFIAIRLLLRKKKWISGCVYYVGRHSANYYSLWSESSSLELTTCTCFELTNEIKKLNWKERRIRM